MSAVRSPLRVAVLGVKTLPAYAGADRVVEHLLEHAPAGIHFTVYLLRGVNEPLRCSGNRSYIYVPALPGKHLRAASYFFLCCAHYLIKGRFDVAHVHNSDFGVFTPLLKLKRRVRIVGTFHGDPYRRAKWGQAAKVFLRLSEWVFVRACDELTTVSAEKALSGRQVYYVPNGLEPPAMATGEPAFPFEELGLLGGYVLFACGRLDRTKGLHHLLRAYVEIPTELPLLVIGDFSHDPAYAREVERTAAQDPRVVLHPELLDRQALSAVLARCSAFVFPSEFEAMSMMLLEAVAAEALVVCSNIPANVAVVGSDYPYLFQSEDAEALSRTLSSALAASDEWDPGPLTRQVAAAFSWPAAAAAYEQLYKRCRAADPARSCQVSRVEG